VDDAVEFAAVERVVRKNADENFKELVLFDVYRGQGIEKGRKSLAIGLILQDKSRTLADTEVDAIIMKIKAKLSDEVGAAFRE
jgi:phenylalanyl-tRNA synthetase beta chain